MVKFLLSLMLLASSWSWGAEVLPHDDVAEVKAEMVGLVWDKATFMVSLDRLAPFEMLRAGFVANGFEESHSGLMQLDHEVINKLQHDFLKLYLEDSEAALASLTSYSGNQIVDIMMMLEYLNADSNSLEIQELNSVLINQLKNKLSPEVLQRLYQALGHIPGINLSQTVSGTFARWSPDGSRLWVQFRDDDVDKIQLYQFVAGGLAVIGGSIPGRFADWSSDGSIMSDPIPRDSAVGFSSDRSRLWVQFWNGESRVQVYQVTGNRREALLSEPILGGKAGWSPDGSRLWVQFRDHGVDKVQVYQVTGNRLVPLLSEPVLGRDARWSPDGSKLWVQFYDNGVYKVQVYQVTGNRLASLLSEPVLGDFASWSPDGSKLWVNFYDDGVNQIQRYQVTADRLVAIGAALPGDYAIWSRDGSKLWVKISDDDTFKIQVYQIINDEPEALLSDPVAGSFASWSPDGSKLFISNEALNQITVYLNLSLMDLDQLLKRFIPNNVLYQNLNFGQQMLLIYILHEHQRTGVIYSLPIKLRSIWNSLPKALRARLIVTGKVIL